MTDMQKEEVLSGVEDAVREFNERGREEAPEPSQHLTEGERASVKAALLARVLRYLESDACKPLDSSPVIRAIADGIVLACRNGNVEGAAEAIATLASCEKGIGRPLVIPVLRAIPDEE